MPDVAQVLGLVQLKTIAVMAIVPFLLQLLAAIIGPGALRLVTLLLVGLLVALGADLGLAIRDAGGGGPSPELYAQAAELLMLAIAVFVTHLAVRIMFRGLARRTTPA